MAKKADFYGLAAKFGLDPVTVRLMVNRGINTEEAIEAFLHADESSMYDPALMKDLPKAADIILETIASGDSIAIAADYDADGIFSGELLCEMITILGGRASIKTSDRVSEGYGLNRRMIDEAKAEGASLVLTCDNGIAAFDAVEYAGSLGITCIITDHHEVPYDIGDDGQKLYKVPAAAAIVNPKQTDCPYPFKGLCGCGVAFKLASYLFAKQGIEMPSAFYAYTAIATVADVMSLEGENRIIVRKGLSILQNTTHVGLSALIRAAGVEDKTISSFTIGFIISPCINAAGRLESTSAAFKLLQCQNYPEAYELAMHLKELNDSRKLLTEEGFKSATELIEGSSLINDDIILVTLDDCHESIAGIIAGRLRERYGKPVFVFVKTDFGYKGSGRSIPAYHMYEGLNACKEHIMQFGGHAAAAGLSILPENIAPLRKALNESSHLTEDDFATPVRIDVPMPIGYISEKLIEELNLLEPFGTGNPKPLFGETSFKIRNATLIGKNRNFLKFSVENSAGTIMDALLFNDALLFAQEAAEIYGADEWKKALCGRENKIDVMLAYYPGVNEFMGARSLQIVISHFAFNK